MSSAEATMMVRAAQQEVQGGAELGLISLEKARSPWCLQLPPGRDIAEGSRLFLALPKDGTRGNGHWPQ